MFAYDFQEGCGPMPTIAVHIKVIGPPPLSSGSSNGSASPRCYESRCSAPNRPKAEQEKCVCVCVPLVLSKQNDNHI